MKHGDPFETHELDELRAGQRRVLRFIPDWLVKRSSFREPPALGTIPPDDRSYLENALRARAMVKMGEMRELLAAFRPRAEADLWRPLLLQEESLRALADHEVTYRALRLLTNDLWEEAERAGGNEMPDPADRLAVAELVVLLVLADAVASDGYSDPRLRSTP